jgi:hypothetical protein
MCYQLSQVFSRALITGTEQYHFSGMSILKHAPKQDGILMNVKASFLS